MRGHIYRAISLASVAGVALSSSMALAATTQADPQAEAAAAAPVAPPVEGGVTEIVVTAQRRSENLQKTALAISAVSSEQLRVANISQPQDLSKLVPALKLSSTGGGGTQVTIRGVGNFSGNAYSEPGVAINLDGVYLARSAGPDGLFYDLERVEVLKGPQGTLYGRNATAGAINIITRKPDDKLSLEGTLTSGNYGLLRAEGAVNAPISEGVALRVAGQVTRRDGYLSDGYSDDRSEAVRGQLKVQPSSDLSVLLSADYTHVGGKGPGSVLAPYLQSGDPYRGSSENGTNAILTGASLQITNGANPNFLPKISDDGFVDIENWGVSATIDYNFGGVKLTVVPAYRHSESNYLHYNAGFPVRAYEASKAKSLEARLGSDNPGGALQWLVGGYYFDEALDFDLFANQGVSFNRTIPNLSTRSYAGFGQATYSLTDTLRLTAGARYTHERKTQDGLNGGPTPSVPAGYPGTAQSYYELACAPYDASTGTCYAALNGRLSQSKVTWKGGVEFDAGARSLVYANVATGFKAGGFFGSTEPNTFKPETLTAFTVGSKNRFFGNTVQFNVEGFYWIYKDKQITHLGPIQPGGFGLITENAGKANIYGVEAELLWQPSTNDRLSLDAQYLHSRYSDFVYKQTTATSAPNTACPTTQVAGEAAVLVDCSGRPVSLSPEWTLNASYMHTFDFADGSALDALVGTQIQSSYWVGEEYLAGEYQKSSMVSNASLTWRSADRRFSLSGFVDNIENEAVKSGSFVQPVLGSTFVVLRAPRTYGLRVNFKLD
ncbi:TonB-dependent receptor plug [Novosphingobium sp. Rr 2-17]|uniref:TonB-dependent receptor n=1 Tax=Novosphingobium sp. Rr 2-17 TaxID=555793 RepID=UPI00026988F8|nr:TonB-dependent receptor [Novosphingobium sp. Rr 2-17]EIZ77616.1 TonB-dependent receptor plug [Novosphingobium sp. Rr 2-17]